MPKYDLKRSKARESPIGDRPKSEAKGSAPHKEAAQDPRFTEFFMDDEGKYVQGICLMVGGVYFIPTPTKEVIEEVIEKLELDSGDETFTKNQRTEYNKDPEAYNQVARLFRERAETVFARKADDHPFEDFADIGPKELYEKGAAIHVYNMAKSSEVLKKLKALMKDGKFKE
jgi:hypothetical protein